MRPSSFLSSLLLLTPLAAAFDPLEVVKRDVLPLLPRKQSSSTKFDLNPTNKEGNTATTQHSSTSNAAGGDSGGSSSSSNSKTTGKDASITSKPTGKTTAKPNTSTTKSSYETTKTFNAESPAGGVQMLIPNTVTNPSQYYRIDQYVTFAWNYTSLSITPTAINVVASCSANSATYTIAESMKPAHGNATQSVVWDTNSYQSHASVPLLMETYTLIIYDADTPETQLPRPGYLGAYDQFMFAMYSAAPFTPTASFICITCGSASTLMEKHTMTFVFGMATLTALSFGWFGGIFGIW